MSRLAFTLSLLLAGGSLASAAETPAPAPTSAEVEGVELARTLTTLEPEKDVTIYGSFNIRDENGRRRQTPVKYFVTRGPESWTESYETRGEGAMPGQLLLIEHRGTNATQYLYSSNHVAGTIPAQMTRFTGAQAHFPFAQSDYLLTDLAREFLHWPRQRIVKDAKITMRVGRPCKVLESVNPNPGGGGYSKVVSWSDIETGALIYAEAYNDRGRVAKVLSLRGFKKINGQWTATELELRNEETDSQTRLELNFQEN